jgi:hypothetical protein
MSAEARQQEHIRRAAEETLRRWSSVQVVQEYEEAFDSTADTFEGMADLGDGIASIPFISLGFNAVKNIRKLHKGDIDMGTAAEHTALDTAASLKRCKTWRNRVKVA